MAGEWIAYDLGLPDKPEVQELIDVTGKPVSEVVFLLLRLWGWAAMNTADGTARMTVGRLVRTCGGDDGFWKAVSDVGWLEIDETVATVAVPGWDRRFSQAAKSRLQQADRAASSEDRRRRAGRPGAQAPEPPAPTRRRGDERRGESPPPPREAAPTWEAFRERWNAGPGRPWTPPTPPDGWSERSADAGWAEAALQAIPRLSGCRYFTSPVTLIQFVKPGFVDRVLGGQYDAPKTARGGAAPADGKTPAAELAERWKQGVDRQAASVAEYVRSRQRRGDG